MRRNEIVDVMREVRVLGEQEKARSDDMFRFVEENREQIPGQLGLLIIDHLNASLRLTQAMTRAFVLATKECSIN